MTQRLRIGNQTSVSCAPLTAFEFALSQGFDAFEWFEDKKENANGTFAGWDASDLDRDARRSLRTTGTDRDVLFTVHAPWQANPLRSDGRPILQRSIALASDLGAKLVNLHLYMEEGPEAYVQGLEPVLRAVVEARLHLSIENTPETTPEDFNDTFRLLNELRGVPEGTVGMCLDIGHANLCQATHNDYVGYLDRLTDEVPIIHVHAHENYGDRDSHLTLFTGPSRANDAGIRAVLRRLQGRDYRGAIILEQWPNPPELLTAAVSRLRAILGIPI